jgi:hypothetical protein
MGIFSYMKPQRGEQKAKPEESKAEMAENPVTQESSATATPGVETPGSISRPASLYPTNDWRSSQSDDLNEIKCDVMVNWLYQQQMERLWTAGGADEGVVLKKSRGQYTCCPADVVDEPYGFFKAIETLNVRVCIAQRSKILPMLTKFAGSNDCQHTSHQALPPQQ